jgi:FMN-dependent NADH-azoreductase
MKLLHIDSSVLGPHSVSRQVSAAIVDRLQKATPGLNVTYRDLTATPLAHLSGSHLAAAQGAVPEAVALHQDLAASWWRGKPSNTAPRARKASPATNG